MKLPDTWLETRLGEVLSRVEAKVDPQTSAISSHFYVGLEHIESHTGRLLRGAKEVTEGLDILSIKTAYQKGDILYGKLRPNLNKVYLAEQEGICSTDIWALRASSAILPEFALHYLRSPAVYIRASQLATGANLPRIPANSFDRIPLPLPTLPEQQRIVDVLRQAEVLTKLRQQFESLFIRTKRQLFIEIFGDPNPKGNSTWPVVKLGNAVVVATGGTPSREQSDNFGGTVFWVKSTDLTDTPIQQTDECLTEIGIQRSNVRVYPKNTILLAMYGQGQTRGRTGKLLVEAGCNQACAALLPSEELLPDYLWVWLQLSYEQVRALGRGGQQENLNLDIVRGIKLPKPPIPLQQEFSRRLQQLLEVVSTMQLAKLQTETLLASFRIEALTGEATAEWRVQHRAEIEAAVIERDTLLRERGTKVSVRTEVFAPPERPTDFSRPMRQWLIDELSEFQHEVWNMLRHEWRGLVIVDDPEAFDDFCTNPQTAWGIEHFKASNKRIRQTLEQLAALGLIAKVSVPKSNAVTQQTEYLIAFRPLREDENTRLPDAAKLKGEWEPSESASSNNSDSSNGHLGSK